MATRKLEIEITGDNSKARKALADTADAVDKVDNGLKRAKDSAEGYGSGIDRVGESADNAETRFTGLASGIDGVTTLMSSPSPQEFAQGIADIGDGMANSAVPAMKSGIQTLKGMNVALAASVVGFVALGAALTVMAIQQQGASIDVDETTRSLTSQDAAVQRNTQNTLKFLESFGGLSGIFDEVLEKTPHLADEFIAQAEAAGVSSDTLMDLREQMGEVASTAQFAADSIRGVNDAIRAQSDPTFAALDAMNQLADANQRVNEATLAVTAAEAEFGAGSAEAQQAAADLSAVQVTAAQAAFGQESAMLELAASMKEAGFSVDDVIAHMQGLASQGLISQSTVDSVSNSLRAVPGNVQTTLYANDLASKEVDKVKAAIAQLPHEKRIQVYLSTWFGIGGKGKGLASGGVVYAASGTMIGGPRGTDTVPAWLTPGEMVLNRDQQSRLFGLLNGRGGVGTGVTIDMRGAIVADEHQFQRMVAKAQNQLASKGIR